MPLFEAAPAIQDEGTLQGNAGVLNFTGSGVTASVAAGTATINIPGGSGATTGTTTVNFGSFPGAVTAITTVTGVTSILTSNKVLPFIDANVAATADHTVDEHLLSEFTLVTTNIVAGTGFDIVACAVDGKRLYGSYNVVWEML